MDEEREQELLTCSRCGQEVHPERDRRIFPNTRLLHWTGKVECDSLRPDGFFSPDGKKPVPWRNRSSESGQRTGQVAEG